MCELHYIVYQFKSMYGNVFKCQLSSNSKKKVYYTFINSYEKLILFICIFKVYQPN